MNELSLFLQNYKWQSFWIIISSLLINMLALCSALYVIQVFNRYLTYKLDSTLIALTIGVAIAFIIEILLRILRSFVVNKVSNINNREYTLKNIKKAIIFKIANNLIISNKNLIFKLNPFKNIQSNNGPEYLVAIIDLFFVFLFILVISTLSIKLGIICSLLLAGYLLIVKVKNSISNYSHTKKSKAINETHKVFEDIFNLSDTVRAFNGRNLIFSKFQFSYAKQRFIEKNFKNVLSILQNFIIMMPIFATIIVIFYGAQEVVNNSLTVGALVGINILNSRMFGPITRMSNFFIQSKENNFIKSFHNLEEENYNGINPRIVSGSVTLKDLSIGYKSTKEVLFQRLNCNIVAGSVVVIHGYNSSGKSSLCKAILGLIDPLKGNILFDGIDIKKINIEWLRTQICYLPQEIELFNLTLKENILINIKRRKEDNIQTNNYDRILLKTLSMVGLNNFINNSKNGINQIITDNGKSLPVGIKKRIGLARAIINDAKILILDEPTESLDSIGVKSLYSILNNAIKLKKTIIIASHNPEIIKNANVIIDLANKPIPRIGIRKPKRNNNA